MNIRGCKPSKAMLVSRKFYIMIDRFISRSLLLVLGCSLVLPVFADVQTTSPATGDSLTATTNSDKSVAPYHVTPGPADGKIAFVTTTLLQQTPALTKLDVREVPRLGPVWTSETRKLLPGCEIVR